MLLLTSSFCLKERISTTHSKAQIFTGTLNRLLIVHVVYCTETEALQNLAANSLWYVFPFEFRVLFQV